MTAATQKSMGLPQLESQIQRVREGSRTFARLSIDERIRLLEELRTRYRSVAEECVAVACAAKGIAPGTSMEGQEWLGHPMVVIRNIRLLIESLQEIKSYGAPRVDPSWIEQLPNGRIAVRVFPKSKMESALLAGTQAWVHMQAGITAHNLSDHQAQFYRKPHEGKVCAVLGAGNVNCIPPTDCLFKMFVEGKVCILKMNPVNAYVGPVIEKAFAPMVERGFFAVTYGGPEEGAILINHPAIDEVHITGSDKTHDTMVWGPPGAERDARKKRNDPLLKKEITSELGNISPILVVPGPYSLGELAFQAHSIAGMIANNASFNCNSPKLLVLPKGWEHRERFMELLEQGLAQEHPRRAYYPGAEQRWKGFVEGRPGVRQVGTAGAGELPWAIIPNVDPSRTEDIVFTQEPWCAVVSETAIASADPGAFLEEAARFANDQVWGTLCATLIVHPKTEASHRAALDKAIGTLRFGSVTVNTWPAAVFGLCSTPWGAYPGSSLQDIQSGRGFVHNTFMLEGVEKVVVTSPLKVMPPWPWFAGHRNAHVLARRLTDFEMAPSWLKIPGLAAAALRA